MTLVKYYCTMVFTIVESLEQNAMFPQINYQKKSFRDSIERNTFATERMKSNSAATVFCCNSNMQHVSKKICILNSTFMIVVVALLFLKSYFYVFAYSK